MKSNKMRNSIMILVLLLFGVSLGYSLLSSNLNISGTTGLSNNTWNIHWSNLSVTNGSVTGTQVTTPATIKTGNTEVEYSITLSTPGDFYEFTVDAVNEGSIDAMIESFSNKTYESNGTTEKNLPSYLNYTVTYSDGIELSPKQKLDAGTTEKIKVRVEFKRDIDSSQLPTTADTIVFKFNVTYIQADDTAETRPTKYTGMIYSNNYQNNDNYNENGDVYIKGETIKEKDFVYDYKDLNGNIFLKHQVENDLVVNSWVCYLENQQPICFCLSENETNNCRVLDYPARLSDYYDDCESLYAGYLCNYNSMEIAIGGFNEYFSMSVKNSNYTCITLPNINKSYCYNVNE